MSKRTVRAVLGLFASVAVFLLLGLLMESLGSPEGKIVSSGEMMVMLAIPTAISFTVGGWVAGEGFVYPAVSLAFVVWVSLTVLSFYWGISLNDVSWDRFIQNLPNAVMIPAAAIGSMLGMFLAARLRRA
jgi:hypothetical protein